MIIQELRDMVAIIGRNPVATYEGQPIFFQYKHNVLTATFMFNDMNVAVSYNAESSQEEWSGVVSFGDLDDLVWAIQDLSAQLIIHFDTSAGQLKLRLGDPHEDHVSISKGVECEFGSDAREVLSLYYCEAVVKDIVLLKDHLDKFEVYHEVVIDKKQWQHFLASASISRRNTERSFMYGINISCHHGIVELASMSPSLMTHQCFKAALDEDPFSFTIFPELIDLIDSFPIGEIKFKVNPDKILVETGRAAILLPPASGTYCYLRTPLNNITNKHAEVAASHLRLAIHHVSGQPTLEEPDADQITIKSDRGSLWVCGTNGARNLGPTDAVGSICLYASTVLDVLKYTRTNLYLYLPENPAQAMLLETLSGVQYRFLGLVREADLAPPSLPTDLVSWPTEIAEVMWERPITRDLAVIPATMAGEPNTVIRMIEKSTIAPRHSNPECLEDDIQFYGDAIDIQYYKAVNEFRDRYKVAAQIAQAMKDAIADEAESKEEQLVYSILADLISRYEWTKPTNDEDEFLDHGGLCPVDLAEEIRECKRLTQHLDLLAGRVLETKLKIKKTYQVEVSLA